MRNFILTCCFIALVSAGFTNPYCTFKGIQCSDNKGTPAKDICTNNYITCVNNEKSVLHTTRTNYQCYNNKIVRKGKCATGLFEETECSYEGIQCVTKEGAVTSEQSYYYQQCENGVLSAVQHTPTGYYCYSNKLVYSGVCPSCTFTGIKCVDSLGDKTDVACTDRYIMCDNGKETSPMPVAPGTQCLNGTQVLPTVCPGRTTGCTYTGIRCVDTTGTVVSNVCTDYYVMCDNGTPTEKRPVAPGTKCYNNEQILAEECSDAQCTFQGIRCVNDNGVIVTDTCTTHFVECTAGGQLTDPLPVADGTKCYNNDIVPNSSCSDDKCVLDTIYCVDLSDTIVMNTCTDRYIECLSSGDYSEPMPVADGTQCYNGKLVNLSQCTSPQCDFEGIKCVDTDGIIVLNVCTDRYVMCDNGKYTDPEPVAPGTQCFNGEQILPANCPNNVGCTFEGIKCINSENSIVTDTCTDRFIMCVDGEYSVPMDVAEGTKCYNGEQILAEDCSSAACDFEGIKCINTDGVIVTDTCTSRYVMCDNGQYTIAMPTAPGTQCLNGEQVLESDCSSAECTFTGIQCINTDGVIVTDTCTDRYLMCVDGEYSDPMPVAAGTKCINGLIVLSTECATTCDYLGYKCVDSNSQVVLGICTDRYVECIDGVQTCPQYTSAGYECKDGDIIPSSECTPVECDFTGIKCVTTDGTIVTSICTNEYVECTADGKLTDPLQVADGTQCLNGQQVLPDECPADTCTPGDLKCVDSTGKITYNECTNYFIGCTAEGVYTSPLQVAAGAQCYNGDQILESACNAGTCDYTGIICVDENGVLVTDYCTAYFAECVNGASVVQDMPAGSLCYDGQFVLTSECSRCTGVTGLRGKSADGMLCYEVPAQ